MAPLVPKLGLGWLRLAPISVVFPRPGDALRYAMQGLAVVTAQRVAGEYAELFLACIAIGLSAAPYIWSLPTLGQQVPLLRPPHRSKSSFPWFRQHGLRLLDHRALALWAVAFFTVREVGGRIDYAFSITLICLGVMAVTNWVLDLGQQVPSLRREHRYGVV